MENNPIKQLDQQVFNQLDQLKSHPNYEKVKETLSMIDHEYKEPLSVLGTVLFFALSMTLIGVFFLINMGLKSDINERKEIVRMSGEILGNKELISKSGRGSIDRVPMNSFNTISNKISSAISNVGVDLSNIQMSDFKSSNISNSVVQSSVALKINDLTDRQFSDVLKSLGMRNKMKVSSLNIYRDDNKKLISGRIGLIHFGKAPKDDN